LPDGDVRVDLRGRDFFVPKDFLNETQIGAVLQHQRRHGVTQQVRASALARFAVSM
jgi:hypothetical protein